MRLRMEWDGSVNNADFEIVDPQGNIYNMAAVAAHAEMEEIAALASSNSRSIGILNPTPGTWTIRATQETGLGEVQFRAFGDVATPELSIDQVVADGGFLTIDFTATDPDSQATIHFYASQNPDDVGGIYLGTAPESDGTGTLQLRTAGWNAGDYYIHAVIDDSDSIPVIAHSQLFTVTVPENPWQNTQLPVDVNGDQVVDVVDALLVNHELLTHGIRDLSGPPEANDHFFDVQGDGDLDVTDAVLVINHLLTNATAAAPVPSSAPTETSKSWSQPTAERADLIDAVLTEDELIALSWAVNIDDSPFESHSDVERNRRVQVP